MIELKHIHKSYDGHITALSDINLTIRDGEIFGIIGQSGAGKSTLVRCINMLEAPTSGEVLVNGKDMTKLSKAELREARKHIGMIFQHFNLLSSRTVYENVSFPLELSGMPCDERDKKIQAILELVGLRNTRINIRRSSPAVKSSASGLRGPLSRIRRYFCRTKRRRHSTRRR